MIIADWNPIAFSIGGLSVRWYGIMVSLAVLTIFLVMRKESKRLGISEDLLYNLFLWGMIGGLVFSRLVHVVDYFFTNPGQPIDWLGFDGLALYGAVMGVPISAFIYTAVMHIPLVTLARLGDAVALGAPLGQAIGRVGCFLNGCCAGGPTDSFCSVTYTNPQSFADYPGIPVQPTQLYLIGWNLVVFLVVFLMRKRPKPDGASFLTYVSLYAAGDFAIRFFRTNDAYLWGLQQAQVIGLGIMAVCVPILIVKWRNFRRQARQEIESVDG